MKHRNKPLAGFFIAVILLQSFVAYGSDITGAALIVKMLQDKELSEKPPIQFLEEIRRIDETMDNLCYLAAEKKQISTYANSWVLYLPSFIANILMDNKVEKRVDDFRRGIESLKLQIAELYQLTRGEKVSRELIPELSDGEKNFLDKVVYLKKSLLQRRANLLSHYKDADFNVTKWEGIKLEWIEGKLQQYLPKTTD